MQKIILAITGASGAIYAQLLMQKLHAIEHAPKVALIASKCGEQVFKYELGEAAWNALRAGAAEHFDNDDMFAACASGSARYEAMLIAPCSMGTLARVAHGCGNSLICRSADVMLKERRRIVLAVREMPYSAVHLRSMMLASQAGAIVCPASPAYYARPATIADLAASVADRLLQLIGIQTPAYQWGALNEQ
jgi:4-hydroxy-3-polyprenylbenzoate decarboxylase